MMYRVEFAFTMHIAISVWGVWAGPVPFLGVASHDLPRRRHRGFYILGSIFTKGFVCVYVCAVWFLEVQQQQQQQQHHHHHHHHHDQTHHRHQRQHCHRCRHHHHHHHHQHHQHHQRQTSTPESQSCAVYLGTVQTKVYTRVPIVQAFSASLPLRMLRRIMLQLCRTFWTTRTLRKNWNLLWLLAFSATFRNLRDNTRNFI